MCVSVVHAGRKTANPLPISHSHFSPPFAFSAFHSQPFVRTCAVISAEREFYTSHYAISMTMLIVYGSRY